MKSGGWGINFFLRDLVSYMLGVSLFLSLSLFTLSFVIFLSLFFLIPLFPLLLSLLPRACHLRRRDRNRPKAESQANNTLSRTLSLFTTIKHVTPAEGWTASYTIVVHHYQTRHSNGGLDNKLHYRCSPLSNTSLKRKVAQRATHRCPPKTGYHYISDAMARWFRGHACCFHSYK